MDQCRFCGEETTIYVEGRPTCLDCTRTVLRAPTAPSTPTRNTQTTDKPSNRKRT